MAAPQRGTDWRPEFIKKLRVPYFNPVVADWNPAAQVEEEKQKQDCGISLYVLTPFMKGVFSIAEIMEDAIERRKGRTVVCLLASFAGHSFNDEHTKRSLMAVLNLAKKYGAKVVYSLEDAAQAVNALAEDPDFSW